MMSLSRKCLTSVVLAASHFASSSREALATLIGPGDIAFVGYSGANPTSSDDVIIFAALADIDSGQKIFFSDEELPIDDDEGTIQWLANQNIAAGSVIRIDFTCGQ